MISMEHSLNLSSKEWEEALDDIVNIADDNIHSLQRTKQQVKSTLLNNFQLSNFNNKTLFQPDGVQNINLLHDDLYIRPKKVENAHMQQNKERKRNGSLNSVLYEDHDDLSSKKITSETDKKLENIMKRLRVYDDKIKNLEKDYNSLLTSTNTYQTEINQIQENIQKDHKNVQSLRDHMVGIQYKQKLSSTSLPHNVDESHNIKQFIEEKVKNEYHNILQEVITACAHEQATFLSNWLEKNSNEQKNLNKNNLNLFNKMEKEIIKNKLDMEKLRLKIVNQDQLIDQLQHNKDEQNHKMNEYNKQLNGQQDKLLNVTKKMDQMVDNIQNDVNIMTVNVNLQLEDNKKYVEQMIENHLKGQSNEFQPWIEVMSDIEVKVNVLEDKYIQWMEGQTVQDEQTHQLHQSIQELTGKMEDTFESTSSYRQSLDKMAQSIDAINEKFESRTDTLNTQLQEHVSISIEQYKKWNDSNANRPTIRQVEEMLMIHVKELSQMKQAMDVILNEIDERAQSDATWTYEFRTAVQRLDQRLQPIEKVLLKSNQESLISMNIELERISIQIIQMKQSFIELKENVSELIQKETNLIHEKNYNVIHQQVVSLESRLKQEISTQLLTDLLIRQEDFVEKKWEIKENEWNLHQNNVEIKMNQDISEIKNKINNLQSTIEFDSEEINQLKKCIQQNIQQYEILHAKNQENYFKNLKINCHEMIQNQFHVEVGKIKDEMNQYYNNLDKNQQDMLHKSIELMVIELKKLINEKIQKEMNNVREDEIKLLHDIVLERCKILLPREVHIYLQGIEWKNIVNEMIQTIMEQHPSKNSNSKSIIPLEIPGTEISNTKPLEIPRELNDKIQNIYDKCNFWEGLIMNQNQIIETIQSKLNQTQNKVSLVAIETIKINHLVKEMKDQSTKDEDGVTELISTTISALRSEILDGNTKQLEELNARIQPNLQEMKDLTTSYEDKMEKVSLSLNHLESNHQTAIETLQTKFNHFMEKQSEKSQSLENEFNKLRDEIQENFDEMIQENNDNIVESFDESFKSLRDQVQSDLLTQHQLFMKKISQLEEEFSLIQKNSITSDEEIRLELKVCHEKLEKNQEILLEQLNEKLEANAINKKAVLLPMVDELIHENLIHERDFIRNSWLDDDKASLNASASIGVVPMKSLDNVLSESTPQQPPLSVLTVPPALPVTSSSIITYPEIPYQMDARAQGSYDPIWNSVSVSRDAYEYDDNDDEEDEDEDEEDDDDVDEEEEDEIQQNALNEDIVVNTENIIHSESSVGDSTTKLDPHLVEGNEDEELLQAQLNMLDSKKKDLDRRKQLGKNSKLLQYYFFLKYMAEQEIKEETEGVKLTEEDPKLKCRYYQNPYPEPDEVVVVNVTDISEMVVKVALLEYDNMEGMILLSELSRKRIRSINRLVRVGKTEIAMVIRVDTEAGYIDLSKQRVDAEGKLKCQERYNKAKAVHSVLRHVAETEKLPLEDLYTKFGWPLYSKYGHAYDAFKLLLTESQDAQSDIFDGLDVNPKVREALTASIRRRLAPQPVKIRSDIEVTCFTFEGIDAIKIALLEGESKGSHEVPVKIKLIAPPMYVMTCMTVDKELGLDIMNQAIIAITSVIQDKGGSIDVKMAPKVVSSREEDELQAILGQLALEKEEEDGDGDGEDS